MTHPKPPSNKPAGATPKYAHWACTEYTSPLTFRTILVNASSDLHLLPSQELFSAASICSIGMEFAKTIQAKKSPFSKASDRDLTLAIELSKTSDLDSYAKVIDEITSDFDPRRSGGPFMETVSLQKTRGNGRTPTPTPRTPESAFLRMSGMLLRLWSVGQLGLSPKWACDTKRFCDISPLSAGVRFDFFNTMEPTFSTLPDAKSILRMDGMLYRLASCSIGIQSIDDLVPGSVAKPSLDKFNTRLPQLLKLIRANQCSRHDPSTVPQTPLWQGPTGDYLRGDHKLAWANPARHPDIKDWHSLLAEWISKRASPGPSTKCSEFILNYLIQNPHVARSPSEFLSRRYSNPTPLSTRIDERFGSKQARFDMINLSHEFFDWMLIEKLSALNDLGRPIPSPDHWNPIQREFRKKQNIQTHREAIPTRYINMMINILVENDYEWPKTIAFDYFPIQNKQTGDWERIWSPVRATAMLLKLLLPLRTYQVCMLDSGELDEEVHCEGKWIANTSPLSRPKRRKGALRKFTDRTTGRTNTGFFINTNKTADRGKEEDSLGYEIPWENHKAINAISKLLNWQKMFNPIAKPQLWADIRDAETRKVLTHESLVKRGEISFLFRDPTGKYINDPLTTGRVGNLWGSLLKELERRVVENGETMPDGSPVKFVEPRKRADAHSSAYTPIYDLHSLRVSLITALATEGGVPIPILSKCIAGHASILMTLYYVKIGAVMVNEELALAQKRIDASEQENFKRFIFEKEAKDFKPFVLTNDEAGFDALKQKNTHLWSINDKGICPVGGMLCNIGGPKTTKTTGTADYAPVPGGARNCVRCRFFATGPAFLGGLVAHFNAMGIELMEASDRHKQKELSIQKLEDDLYELGGNDAILLAKINISQDRQEEDMKEIDNIACNWHAIYAFIERSKAILAKPLQAGCKSIFFDPKKDDSKSTLPNNSLPDVQTGLFDRIALVLGGDEDDFGVVMQESTRFEAFNSVCQMAVAYPAEKAIPIANLRRSKLLDAMLSRNGCKPVFASLSDEEAMAVGNQLSTLLLAKLGRVEAANLIEGRRMLEGSGIFKDVQLMVQSHSELGFIPANATIQPVCPKELPKPKKPIKNAKDST